VGRRDIRNVLLHLRQRGKTIFLNSHLLSELEMVCDHVAILVQGAVSAQGTLDDLTRDSRRYEIEIDLPAAEPRQALPAVLAGVSLFTPQPPPSGAAPADTSPGGTVFLRGTLRGSIPVTASSTSMTIGSDNPADVQAIIDAIRLKGLTIRSVRPMKASLEDLFMLAVKDPGSGGSLNVGAAPAGRRARP
jgi:ABC-2 type transport system ATP-binding protein